MSSRRPQLFRPITRGAARAFTVLAVLSLVLSAASGWIAVRAVQGEIASRASTLALCEAGNQARAQQVQLWQHIIVISAPPPRETPAQHAARAALIAGFQKYVRQVFAARDCNHLTGG